MPVPAKAGTQYVRGGCRPPVRLRLRLRRELDPPGGGLHPPPAKGGTPHRIPANRKEGLLWSTGKGSWRRRSGPRGVDRRVGGGVGPPWGSRPWRRHAKGGGSSHAFGRATECPSAQADGQPYRAGSYRPHALSPGQGTATCSSGGAGGLHRPGIRLSRKGGSPRSARSSRRPAARPGGHGRRAQLLHGNCSNGIVKPWRCSSVTGRNGTEIAAHPPRVHPFTRSRL